jgi:hypothetical protein
MTTAQRIADTMRKNPNANLRFILATHGAWVSMNNDFICRYTFEDGSVILTNFANTRWSLEGETPFSTAN